MLKYIIKRNGSVEDAQPEKLIKWVQWAKLNVKAPVEWQTVVSQAFRESPETMTSQELQMTLVNILVSRGDWACLKMAGRLFAAYARKQLYNDKIPTLKQLHTELFKEGLMIDMGQWYSARDYELVEKIIDHDRDFDLVEFQIQQDLYKYGIQNRVTGKLYEMPQFIAMRMAMFLAAEEPIEERLIHIANYYDHFSFNRINAPSPNYINLATGHNGLASCCLYKAGDNAKSLAVGDHIAYIMTCMSAGIGNTISTRAIGDPVRGGTIIHQGKYPYFQSMGKSTVANIQAGRGGALTTYFNAYDPEAGAITMMQNPRTPEQQRNRDIHFAAVFNAFLLVKALQKNKEDRQVFSFTQWSAPDLYEACYQGDDFYFQELYEKYEKNVLFKKNYFDARELLKKAYSQGFEVGTFYFFNSGEVNRHTPLLEPIYSSNLCAEIMEHTREYQEMKDLYTDGPVGYVRILDEYDQEIKMDYNKKILQNGQISFVGLLKKGDNFELFDDDKIALTAKVKEVLEVYHEPEVALCSLGGIVYFNCPTDALYRSAAYYALKMVSRCIHLSHYPLPHIGYTAKQRMNAAIGVVGAATHLARLNLKYDTQEGRNEIHRMAERHAYFVISGSLQIAKETQVAPWIHKTKWPRGWVPTHTYNRNVDELVTVENQYDWEALSQDIIATGGIAHSTVIAHMPTESSSKRSGSPNSWYPIRNRNMKKSDSGKVIDWGAPDNDIIGDQYQLAWDVDTIDLLKDYAIIQKWSDHSISADTYMDRSQDITVKTSDMMNQLRVMVKYGVKTRYYQNSYVSSKQRTASTAAQQAVNQVLANATEGVEFIGIEDEDQERGCAGGACTI